MLAQSKLVNEAPISVGRSASQTTQDSLLSIPAKQSEAPVVLRWRSYSRRTQKGRGPELLYLTCGIYFHAVLCCLLSLLLLLSKSYLFRSNHGMNASFFVGGSVSLCYSPLPSWSIPKYDIPFFPSGSHHPGSPTLFTLLIIHPVLSSFYLSSSCLSVPPLRLTHFLAYCHHNPHIHCSPFSPCPYITYIT